MSMFKDIPVDVGVIYEGERIRRNDMQVELGGPTVKEKFELAKVKPMDEVEDGKITIIGPDIKDLKEGGAYPLGILVEAAGAKTRSRARRRYRKAHSRLPKLHRRLHASKPAL